MKSSHQYEVSELLQLARAGDVKSLGELFELYRSYLLLLARIEIGRKLQSKVDAVDLVQDVFLDAFRQFPNFQGIAPSPLRHGCAKFFAAS